MERTLVFKDSLRQFINTLHKRHVVNVPPTATGKRRFRLPVETDAHKLVNYCCGADYHIDDPPVKLKPDNEYPDWLWKLRLGPKPKSYELEKGTKEYYKALTDEAVDRNYLLKMRKRKPIKVVGRVQKDHLEYLHKIRFRALAFLEDDYGYKQDTLDKDIWHHVKDVEAREYYLPMNENSFLYMDEIEGNSKIKNFARNQFEDFRGGPRVVPPRYVQAKFDKRHRHWHAVT